MNFQTNSFYNDPFFSALGTFGGVTCRLLWREVAGMKVDGQLQARPGRWIKWGVRKNDVATRPDAHTAIVVNGGTWYTDGEPTDNGNDWIGMAVMDQRKSK